VRESAGERDGEATKGWLQEEKGGVRRLHDVKWRPLQAGRTRLD